MAQGFSKCVDSNTAGGAISVTGKTFTFDFVCDEKEAQARLRASPVSTVLCWRLRWRPPSMQASIFASAGKSITDGFLEGYHGCIIAYGALC